MKVTLEFNIAQCANCSGQYPSMWLACPVCGSYTKADAVLQYKRNLAELDLAITQIQTDMKPRQEKLDQLVHLRGEIQNLIWDEEDKVSPKVVNA